MSLVVVNTSCYSIVQDTDGSNKQRRSQVHKSFSFQIQDESQVFEAVISSQSPVSNDWTERSLVENLV